MKQLDTHDAEEHQIGHGQNQDEQTQTGHGLPAGARDQIPQAFENQAGTARLSGCKNKSQRDESQSPGYHTGQNGEGENADIRVLIARGPIHDD